MGESLKFHQTHVISGGYLAQRRRYRVSRVVSGRVPARDTC